MGKGMRFFGLTALQAALVAAAAPLHAAVTFTIQATVEKAPAGGGFSQGETLSVELTTNGLYAPARSNKKYPNNILWMQQAGAEPSLWTMVTVSGTSGNWAFPVAGILSANVLSGQDRIAIAAGKSGMASHLTRGTENIHGLSTIIMAASGSVTYRNIAVATPENVFHPGKLSLGSEPVMMLMDTSTGNYILSIDEVNVAVTPVR